MFRKVSQIMTTTHYTHNHTARLCLSQLYWLKQAELTSNVKGHAVTISLNILQPEVLQIHRF